MSADSIVSLLRKGGLHLLTPVQLAALVAAQSALQAVACLSSDTDRFEAIRLAADQLLRHVAAFEAGVPQPSVEQIIADVRGEGMS